MDGNGLAVIDEPPVNGMRDVTLKRIFVVLAVLIFGLVAGIAVVMIMNRNTENACLNMEGSYEISVCIDGFSKEKGIDEAVLMYDKAVNQAYEKGNNGDYYNLLLNRSFLLSVNNDCTSAVELLNDERVEGLPITDEKGVYYSRSLGLADSCGNLKEAKEFADKLMEVNASGEIEVETF